MNVTPRILHVLDHSLPLHSGYSFRTASILREQRRLGWVTGQVTGPKQEAGSAEELAEGLPYWRTAHTAAALARWPLVNQLDVVVALRRRLRRLIAEFRPNIIHAHSPCLNGVAAAAAARAAGLPFVYELRASWEDAAVSHGTTTEGSLRYRLSHALESRVVHAADAVTTICEGLRADIALRGVPESRITVIPNAVDIEHFSAEVPFDGALKGRLCGPDALLIGFIGSFYAYEGLDLLIAAMPEVLRRFPRAHLMLVGGGPEEARLRAQRDTLGLQRTISFPGRIPPGEVPAYYRIATVMVYPRRSNRLTEMVTPLKPLEAMAQQCLVAASDVGGHRELVRSGRTGVLFPADSVAAVADGIEATLRLPDSDAVRRAGREFVSAERSWSKVVAGYAPVYEPLCERVIRGTGIADAA